MDAAKQPVNRLSVFTFQRTGGGTTAHTDSTVCEAELEWSSDNNRSFFSKLICGDVVNLCYIPTKLLPVSFAMNHSVKIFKQ